MLITNASVRSCIVTCEIRGKTFAKHFDCTRRSDGSIVFGIVKNFANMITHEPLHHSA